MKNKAFAVKAFENVLKQRDIYVETVLPARKKCNLEWRKYTHKSKRKGKEYEAYAKARKIMNDFSVLKTAWDEEMKSLLRSLEPELNETELTKEVKKLFRLFQLKVSIRSGKTTREYYVEFASVDKFLERLENDKEYKNDRIPDANERLYCTCRRMEQREMIRCDDDDCTNEWFHYACVNITKPPTGEWFCPSCTGNHISKKSTQDASDDVDVEDNESDTEIASSISSFEVNRFNNSSHIKLLKNKNFAAKAFKRVWKQRYIYMETVLPARKLHQSSWHKYIHKTNQDGEEYEAYLEARKIINEKSVLMTTWENEMKSLLRTLDPGLSESKLASQVKKVFKLFKLGEISVNIGGKTESCVGFARFDTFLETLENEECIDNMNTESTFINDPIPDSNEQVYCTCRKVQDGDMVKCDNSDCIYEWFHFECVNLTEPPSSDEWFCPSCIGKHRSKKNTSRDNTDEEV
jgi:hypothetical protein